LSVSKFLTTTRASVYLYPFTYFIASLRNQIGKPMLHIRAATMHDVALLGAMIRELAGFEHQLQRVAISEEDLLRDGFGESPQFRAIIAEWEGQAAGYALFFGYYSTWNGRGLYVEDLFVREAFRGRGIGKVLLAEVARIAVAEYCHGLRWEVLGWNKKAIDLYTSLGVEFYEEWRSVSLTGEPLRRLAAK
jgi:GNAT superfamily N-acetyltransferase